jgi:hypothetical protein
MVRHYRSVVELAAKHHISIDAHEPIKPTGIERTWPNMMTREGVRGMEYNAWSEGNPPEHTAILPFTRMLAGPADYTPGIFDLQFDPTGRHRVYTTLAKQLSLYVVLYSPLQMAADLIENYKGHPAFAFIQAVPVSWDETRVINGEIGDYVSIARRSGEEWYLGTLTDENPRRLELPLSFLKAGQSYAAHIYCDSAETDFDDAPEEFEMGQFRVTQGDTIAAVLARSGGMAVRFAPVGSEEEAAKLPPLAEFAKNDEAKWNVFAAVQPYDHEKARASNQPADDPLSRENRGNYFAKKEYKPTPLPGYDEFKKSIPVPVLDLHAQWLEMYWKCWELAHKHLRQPREASGFVSNYLDEAFSDNIFQWDTIFMILFARYNHAGFPVIASLDNFYAKQHANGYICREIKEDWGIDFVYLGPEHTVNPPLFGWAELASYRMTGDKERLGLVLPVLAKYAEWLEAGRRSQGTKHGLFWNTGLGSGMDNTPRRGSGWTDMSCQMVMLYEAMAEMCEAAGKAEAGAKHSARAKEIAEAINRWMWDEQDGLYYDVDDDGKQIKHKTAACFWPLTAGVASAAQAERLVVNLKDMQTFWTPMVFPTLAADHESFDPEGGYWKGGVWAPTNVAIIEGLRRYGYHEFAAHATVRYLTGMYAVFQKTGTVWENYAPASFAPGKPSRSDFVGWSGCGPISLLIENVVGLQCDAPNNRLTWHLRRADRHGIQNLRFGETTVSAISAERQSLDQPAKLTVESDRAFELQVDMGGKMHRYDVKPGKQEISVP